MRLYDYCVWLVFGGPLLLAILVGLIKVFA